MSSELCKPPKSVETPPTSSKEPAKEPVDTSVSGRTLRSKHLRVISSELGNVVSDRIPEKNTNPDFLRRELFTYFNIDEKGFSAFQKPMGKVKVTKKTSTTRTIGGKSRVVRKTTPGFEKPDPQEPNFLFYSQDNYVPKKEAVNGIISKEDKKYTYINFTLDVPFSEREIRANTIVSGRERISDPGYSEADPRISTYKFEPRYNFFQQKYEDKIANKQIDPRAIPNAHAFSYLVDSLFDKDGDASYDEDYLNYLSYNSDKSKLREGILTKDINALSRYQRKYVTRGDVNLISSSQLTEQENKFNNVLVVQDDILEYSRLSETFYGTAGMGFYLELPLNPPSKVKTNNAEIDSFKKIFKITNTDLSLYNVIVKTGYDIPVDAARQARQAGAEVVAATAGLSEEDRGGFFDVGEGSVFGEISNASTTQITLDGPGGINSPQAVWGNLLPMSTFCFTQTSYLEPKNNTAVNALTSDISFTTWDLTEFFTNYEQKFDSLKGTLKNLLNINNSKSSIIIGETNEAVKKYRNNAVFEFFQKLMNKVAAFQFKQRVESEKIQDPTRIFKNLLETPYEVIFYKIQKKDASGEILQNFYLASPEEDEQFKFRLLRFFDSQVKYGLEYTYDVFAYTMVLAKKYQYSETMGGKPEATSKKEIDKLIADANNLYDAISSIVSAEESKPAIDTAKLKREQKRQKEALDNLNRLKNLKKSFENNGYPAGGFDVFVQDYIPLMEIPIFSTGGKILDKPPVSPVVEFIPFKDNTEDLMIYLRGESTEYYAHPQIINPEDQKQINDIIRSRGTDKLGKILYGTDDYLSRFEIYRMEEKPRSYTDFSSHLRRKFDLKDQAPAVAFLDRIVPNKKYYYTFRSFDVHGHFSNPTPVYEFVLYDDAGFLSPQIRIVNFEDDDYYEFTRDVRQYLQIKPSAQNLIFDPDLFTGDIKSANELDFVREDKTEPPLGISDTPVWGRKFKVRITSKSTGRKVDVNFSFKRKNQFTKEDIKKSVEELLKTAEDTENNNY